MTGNGACVYSDARRFEMMRYVGSRLTACDRQMYKERMTTGVS